MHARRSDHALSFKSATRMKFDTNIHAGCCNFGPAFTLDICISK